MTTLLKPSTFLPKGLCIQRVNNLTLFKFTDELGERILNDYPHISAADLVNAWAYAEAYPEEIEVAIQQNEEV